MGDIHGQNIGHNHSLQKRYLSFYIHYINTVSFKQKGYCWTARTGRKMPKKCLGHVFKTLSAPHDVVQLSVNFWHLCLLGLGANLVLGSILVGNHLCKVAPKSENSLLFFFRVAMGSGPLKKKNCWKCGVKKNSHGHNFWNFQKSSRQIQENYIFLTFFFNTAFPTIFFLFWPDFGSE